MLRSLDISPVRVESRIAGSRWLRAGWLLGSAFAIAAAVPGCGSPSTPSKPVDQFPDGPKISCPATPPTLTSPSGQPIPVLYGTATASGGAPAVSLSCTPSSGSSFPVGSTTVVCTAMDARQRSDACSFAVIVQSAPRLSLTRFLAFGDSITWGEDGRDSTITAEGYGGPIRPAFQFPAAQTYPGALQIQLQARYSGQSIQVANAGLKGEAAGDSATPGRLSSLIAGRAFDVVLLMEGSNDLADRDNSDIEPAIRGLRAMIQDAKSRGLRVFLATVPPMVPGGFRALPWSLVPTLNGRIRSLASEQGVTLVDIEAAFGQSFQQYIGFDGLHPNAAGYAKMADTFFAALKNGLEVPAAAQLAPARVPLVVRPRR
jgi:lysophospholipase L1-like esterase